MKDLVIKVGEYEKGGEKKGRYVKLGTILQGENGEYALIEPTVDLAGCLIQQRLMNGGKGSSLMCSIFEKTSKGSVSATENNNSDNNLGF